MTSTRRPLIVAAAVAAVAMVLNPWPVGAQRSVDPAVQIQRLNSRITQLEAQVRGLQQQMAELVAAANPPTSTTPIALPNDGSSIRTTSGIRIEVEDEQ